MSSFKNFSSMLNDLQRQADGRGTLDGSAIEDFLSIAGYEDPNGGGGGGESDYRIIPLTIINGETGEDMLITGIPCVDYVTLINESYQSVIIGNTVHVDNSIEIADGGSVTVNILTYKGSVVLGPLGSTFDIIASTGTAATIYYESLDNMVGTYSLLFNSDTPSITLKYKN